MREHTNGLSRRAFIGGAVMLGAASIVAPTTAFATTAAEKQAEADAVRNQLVGLQADLEAAADSYKQALALAAEYELLFEAVENSLRDLRRVARAAVAGADLLYARAKNHRVDDLDDGLGDARFL